jgi:hypothetical protein
MCIFENIITGKQSVEKKYNPCFNHFETEHLGKDVFIGGGRGGLEYRKGKLPEGKNWGWWRSGDSCIEL